MARTRSSFSVEPTAPHDLAAARPRDLHARAANTSGRSGHEHARAGPHRRLARERDPGGEEGQQERGALLERRVARQVEQPLVVDDRALRVAAPLAPDEADDAPAVVRLAGDLAARHERERRRLRVAPFADQDIGVVDPGRAHLDDHLPVSGLGLGDVTELEPPPLVEDDGFHRTAVITSVLSAP